MLANLWTRFGFCLCACLVLSCSREEPAAKSSKDGEPEKLTLRYER